MPVALPARLLSVRTTDVQLSIRLARYRFGFVEEVVPDFRFLRVPPQSTAPHCFVSLRQMAGTGRSAGMSQNPVARRRMRRAISIGVAAAFVGGGVVALTNTANAATDNCASPRV